MPIGQITNSMKLFLLMYLSGVLCVCLCAVNGRCRYLSRVFAVVSSCVLFLGMYLLYIYLLYIYIRKSAAH